MSSTDAPAAPAAPPVDPTLQDVYLARRRLARFAYRTPLEASPWLSEIAGCAVYLKLECWQRTRSFKARGAYNAIAGLAHDTRAGGLVAASAGNHGQGVALAADSLGARCTVFVPAGASELKVGRIRALGAEVRMVEGIYNDAAAAAHEFAEASGAYYVHAFSDPAIVAGQGTVGLEILEELPALAEVVVPVGGGGLVAGVGTVLKSASPGARVTGVQTEHACSMAASFEAGRAVLGTLGETIADGLHGGVEEASYRRARRVVDRMVVIPETGLEEAIRELYRRHGVVAEGSGAVPVAAVLGGRLDVRGPAVLVISGGNIDAGRLGRILARE